MRYFIDLSYDGTAYHGWQVQPNANSVQGCLQDALATLLRQPVAVTGAGRTDTGVHARLMVAHFDFEGPFFPSLESAETEAQCAQLTYKLNKLLPRDIAIHRIYPVAPDAHARFDARARTYYYYVHTRKDPFLVGRSWFLPNTPDFEAMNRAAAVLFDYIDFTSFSKVQTDTKTNNCRIMLARWVQFSDYEWRFEITADRFLRNMVRAIVGTLMLVGRGDIDIDGFRQIIDSRDRCAAGESVPACGLYLQNIDY